MLNFSKAEAKRWAVTASAGRADQTQLTLCSYAKNNKRPIF